MAGLVFGSVTAMAAAPAPIAVAVTEAAGVDREAWPVTFSLPLPRGLSAQVPQLAIRDEKGAALPVQARSLVLWPDGSVRWLQVDTQVSVAARATLRLEVLPGAPAKPPVRLSAVESTAGINVDTGAVRFSIPRGRFALFEAPWGGGENSSVLGAIGSTMLIGKEIATAQAPRGVRVLDKGPLRTLIEITGTYGNGFDYEARIEAYAGQPFVRLFHTFIKTSGAAYSDVNRLSVEIPLPKPGGGSFSYGLVNGAMVAGELAPAGSLRLHQIDNQRYAVDGEVKEGALSGWLETGTSAQAVGVAARWFGEEYPKAIEIGPSGLVYDLWARDGAAARVGIGAAKTHEFVVWRSEKGRVGKSLAPVLATPLVASVDPNWLVATRALPGAVAPPAAGFIEQLSTAANAYLARNAAEIWRDCGKPLCGEEGVARTGAFGMFNWGDWNFPGYNDDVKGTDSWGNQEYDTTQVLALAFAATGEPSLRDAMVAAARHFADVDTIHAYPKRSEWVGMNHPKNPMHFSFELGGVDLGHTWTEGLVSYYFLSGDERALRAARGIASYLAQRIRSGARGNARQWGWPQIALLAVHDATGDRRYLDAARNYARGGMGAHPPTSGGGWKLGILADALSYTHAATGDPSIAKWLEAYTKRVGSDPTMRDSRYFPAVAYQAALTADEKLSAAALRAVSWEGVGSWGKPFTITGRTGLRIHALLSGPSAPGGGR